MFNLTDKQQETINKYCGNEYYIMPEDEPSKMFVRVTYFHNGNVRNMAIMPSGVIGYHWELSTVGHWERIENE